MRGDPFIGRWSGLAHEDPASWVARQHERSYAVVDGDGRPLGKAALKLRGEGRGELGYWLLPGARGRGAATAACRALAALGFVTLGLRSIVLEVDVDNPASHAVARRLGARVVDATCTDVDRTGVERTLTRYELRPR